MIDTLVDRAERLLSDARRIAVPLPELAARLGAEPSSLAPRLEEDHRFLLIHPITVLDLTLLPPADRDAYSAALQAAGMDTVPRVALAEPPDLPGRPVERLLRESVTRLLARSPEHGLAVAAERALAALTAVGSPADPPGDHSSGIDPSTTHPPGPPALARAPPRRPAPPPRRPPYRGSRRG